MNNTIGAGGRIAHTAPNVPAAPTGREQAPSAPTTRARASSNSPVSGRVSMGPTTVRRHSLPGPRSDPPQRSTTPAAINIVHPPQEAPGLDTTTPSTHFQSPTIEALSKSIASDLQKAKKALDDAQTASSELVGSSKSVDPSYANNPSHWMNDCKGLNASVEKLPPKNPKAVAAVATSLLSATSRAMDWTLRCTPGQFKERDEIQFETTGILKDVAGHMRSHGVVHDETRMNALIDGFMGAQGNEASGQTAISELPQHALDLERSDKGDAQTVRMMTKMAEMAVQAGGLRTLKCDPSWAEFLITNRIQVVLNRKEIDLGEHEALRNAIDALREKGNELELESKPADA